MNGSELLRLSPQDAALIDQLRAERAAAVHVELVSAATPSRPRGGMLVLPLLLIGVAVVGLLFVRHGWPINPHVTPVSEPATIHELAPPVLSTLLVAPS